MTTEAGAPPTTVLPPPGTDPTESEPPRPLSVTPSPTTEAPAAGPSPPEIGLTHDDDMLTIIVTGTPNYTFELHIDGPGDEDYEESGRLNGPSTAISIRNPTKGQWSASATLTDHAGQRSEIGTSPNVDAPTPPDGQPTSAELAASDTLTTSSGIASNGDEANSAQVAPWIIAILILATLATAAILLLRRVRAGSVRGERPPP